MRKYDIDVSVSIDGPKQIHDRCRLTPLGKKTYDKVISNLEKLVDIDQQYFRKHANVAFTIPSLSHINNISNYHQCCEVLRDFSSISINLISTDRLKEGVSLSVLTNLPNDSLNEAFETRVCFERYLRGLIDGDVSALKFENELFFRGLKRIYGRKPLGPRVKAGGLCSPSKSRLFVKADGDIKFCEKTDTIPIIGNLAKGINWNQLELMGEDYIKSCRPCFDCWAIMICDMCWAYLYSGGNEIDVGQKRDNCEMIKNRLSFYLQMYARISEEPATALNTLAKHISEKEMHA